jgi:hypothetical protein
VEAYDDIMKKNCAIKIIKSIPKYAEAAKVEIKVLKKVKEYDPLNKRLCTLERNGRLAKKYLSNSTTENSKLMLGNASISTITFHTKAIFV